jgi:DNA polymerase-3 subunit epsilon/exodeoxyribonuclease X
MLIFLDVETTGIQSNDKICSIGIIAVEDEKIITKYNLVNEDKKISSQASSTHHITNEMIKNTQAFIDSDIYKFLEKHNNENTTMIVHNSTFVLEKLYLSGFYYKGATVDIQRVTKHLIEECEMFTLQFLRYELKLYEDEVYEAKACGIKDALFAHNALSDALIIKLLFNYLRDMVSLEEMYELSFKNVLLSKFTFGKYSGKYIEEVAINDKGYLEWMLSLSDLDEELRYSIEYYL